MIRTFSSLYAKIFFWLFLNLAVITGVLIVFYAFQSQMDINAFFGRQTFDRMWATGRLISYDLSQADRKDWADVLTRHSKISQVNFAVVLEDGSQFLSKKMKIAGTVIKRVVDDFRPGFTGQEFGGDEQRRQDNRYDKKPRMMMRTKDPKLYWAGIPIPLPVGRSDQRPVAMLLAASDSITGNGFFFDPFPWIIVGATVLFISTLFWIPLVRSISRPVIRMTHAAEEIARGKFDVRINEPRTDEIGRLGTAINKMTLRLSAYMKGQKRFLGDVAHELGSPIARIQFGLAILDQRTDDENRKRVAGVIEDVDHMSNLVNELLSFSRAEMNSLKVKLLTTELSPIIQRVIQREGSPETEIIIEIEPHAHVIADPELLTRALANLVRNAVRYAGSDGPIFIKAREKSEKMVIEVQDSGCGIPENLLDQLFEPFYRLETSRDRELGGVGLGLAIVKTCVEACGGTVYARNLNPAGFAVSIILDTSNQNE